MTRVFESIAEWQVFRKKSSLDKKVIGFVPTMGNLHDGHLSLLRRARHENDISVLSIFINPTQFNDEDDLAKYPRTLSEDLALAKEMSVDYLLFPKYQDLYKDSYRYKVIESKLSQIMEGKCRSGSFAGMMTVVMKFLMLIKPSNAYFGEKDFQQLQLVSDMAEAFFIDTKIVACPTIRDENGLALSSRNSRLTKKQYQTAIKFPGILSSTEPLVKIVNDLKKLGFVVDYIEEFQGRRYGAVRLGSVRLIDNFVID